MGPKITKAMALLIKLSLQAKHRTQLVICALLQDSHILPKAGTTLGLLITLLVLNGLPIHTQIMGLDIY